MGIRIMLAFQDGINRLPEDKTSEIMDIDIALSDLGTRVQP